MTHWARSPLSRRRELAAVRGGGALRRPVLGRQCSVIRTRCPRQGPCVSVERETGRNGDDPVGGVPESSRCWWPSASSGGNEGGACSETAAAPTALGGGGGAVAGERAEPGGQEPRALGCSACSRLPRAVLRPRRPAGASAMGRVSDLVGAGRLGRRPGAEGRLKGPWAVRTAGLSHSEQKHRPPECARPSSGALSPPV